MQTIRNLRREEGFTLIELMIVIVVLGILAGIAIFGVSTFRSDAETATDEANDKICEIAQTAFIAKDYTGTFGDYFSTGTPPAGCTQPVP